MTSRKSSLGNIWLYRLIDLTLPTVLLYSVSHTWIYSHLILGILNGLVFVLLAQYLGLYRFDNKKTADVKTIFKIWVILLVLILIIDRVPIDLKLSNATLFLWITTTFFFLFIYRITFKRLLVSQDQLYGNIAIIGAGNLGINIAESIQNDKLYSKALIHFFDDDKKLKGSYVSEIPVIDKISKFKQYIDKYNLVYICLPLKCGVKINEIIELSSEHSVVLKFVPDIPTFDLLSSNVENFHGRPVIGITNTPATNLTLRATKRFEDLVLSLFIVTLILPLLILISIAIKLGSNGPIIFKQKRYGLDGKEFTMYKFRSMTSLDDGNLIIQATKNDDRVTKIGSLLRRLSLDELPQFFNVIKGDMSIVGPRPHAVAHNEEYKKLIPKYMQRHLMKPGITGWAQINGLRGETRNIQQMKNRIDFDLHYINTWSLWFDIKIILLTIFKGFAHKNAY